MVADYFRNKTDWQGDTAEAMGAVDSASPTVLIYIDVGETDCAEIVRAVLTALKEPEPYGPGYGEIEDLNAWIDAILEGKA